MNKSLFFIIDLIAAAVISILVFTFCDISSASFVFSYIFLLIAVILQLLPIIIKNKKDDIAGNISYHTLSLIYFLCQMCVSIVGFSILRNSNKSIFAMSLVLLLVYAAVFLILNFIFSKGSSNRQAEKEKSIFCDLAVSRLQQCRNGVNDEEIVAGINKSIDYIKYGSITTPDKAKDIEDKILSAIDEIEDMIAKEKHRDCKIKCNELNRLLEERKNISYIYK